VFRYDASFRIGGLGDVQDEIETLTGLKATRAFRAGEPLGLRGSTRKESLWLLQSPLGERASHDEHVNWLWTQIAPHKDQFRKLVQEAVWADVCLGCISESAYPVLSVEPSSLDIVRELRIGLAFNFTVS
jgi:hypothetical protein